MITAVKNQLSAMGKLDCVSDTLHGQEKGKSVKLSPSPRGDAIKIKVDGHLITDKTKKCDCLYFYQQSKSKKYAFLVELKGNNYLTALEQLIATKAHENYINLHHAVKPCSEYAVVIVSKKANTNRPKKEVWEDENGIRLKVFASQDNNVVDLIDILKK